MASVLSNAIKFRSLADELTKQELKQFLNKIVDSNKARLITTSFFNYFIKQNIHINTENKNNSDDLDDVNAMLSNIIQSREQKPKQHSKVNIKLNQLPQSIIGYTASFLEEFEYFQFEKTNRSIFIGCNSPNMLSIFDLRIVNNYAPIDLSKYRSVRKLYINLPQFEQFKLPDGQLIMPELTELLLDGQEKSDFDIEPFMSSTCFNFEKIKSLKLDGFYSYTFNLSKLYRLLTKFPNIECMELINLCVADHIKPSKLKQLCPKMNGLGIIGGINEDSNALINAFGNNLHFLAYDVIENNSTDFSNINFEKLKEVTLIGVGTQTMNDVLQTGINIHKFALSPHSDMKKEELKGIIPQVLKCQSLKYFEIEAKDQNFTAILDGIENGLYQTMKYERKSIKIAVGIDENCKINIKEMIVNIGRIIHWLESSNINDFMFIMNMDNSDEQFQQQFDVNEILHDLNGISSNIQVQSVHEFSFVITNKHCKINGFEETWMVR